LALQTIAPSQLNFNRFGGWFDRIIVMFKIVCLALATATAFAVPSFAQTATTAAVPPALTLKYLQPSDVDPAKLLPPPIMDGSYAQKAEVEEVLHLQQAASAARRDQAVWDDRHEDGSLWEPTLGPSFSLAKLPATAAVLEAVLKERDYAADKAKVYFDRLRPWTFNADIQVCEAKGRDGAQRRSYPSGHGTLSFSQGVVLANLMPEKSQIILARAADFALSRVICGVHSKSDIVASQTLGTTIGVLMLHNAEFKPMLDAARSELKVAGLTN
jgi:acid phosphatase (class A)